MNTNTYVNGKTLKYRFPPSELSGEELAAETG